ncbi:MAG TPA: hypothetical protein VN680_11405 [Burkholderiaceae bacterium]|jgi:hypothetical protein|nr:hypothetical protein [Burkholderiaceae bacterium]
MPFGQTRVVPDGVTVVDGVIPPVVEGTVVEGTVVEGTVVEGIVVDGVVEGEMLGGWPTTLLPVLARPIVGVVPTLLPNVLGAVPVMLGCVVVPNGEDPIPGVVVAAPGVVATPPGVVAAAPGAAAPAPAVPAPAAPPTWANAGRATVASSASGRRTVRRVSSMGNLLCYWADCGQSRKLHSNAAARFSAKPLKTHVPPEYIFFRCTLSH